MRLEGDASSHVLTEKLKSSHWGNHSRSEPACLSIWASQRNMIAQSAELADDYFRIYFSGEVNPSVKGDVEGFFRSRSKGAPQGRSRLISESYLYVSTHLAMCAPYAAVFLEKPGLIGKEPVAIFELFCGHCGA